jgi:hypothetical protein
MRWLLIHPGPSWSVADVFNGWSEALGGLGEQVEEYELDARLRFYNSALAETGELLQCGCPGVQKFLDREQAIQLAVDGILGAAYRWWPDVILCTSAFFIPPWLLEILRRRKHKIVMLMTESPYQDDFQLKMARYADLTLLNDPVNLDAYREIGPAHYMPHAYREKIHYPAVPGTEPEYDLAFIGTGFPSRVRFFSGMDLAGLNVRLSGLWMDLPEDSPLRDWTATDSGDCVDNTETADIYRRSRCGINFYRVEAEAAHEGEGTACGPREIEMAATGLWFARDPRPESDQLFPMLPSFASPAEASDLIRWALAHPGERAEAAARARAAVAGRTFTEHARSLLRLLDRQPVTMLGRNDDAICEAARPERADLPQPDQRRRRDAAAVPGVLDPEQGHRQAGSHRVRRSEQGVRRRTAGCLRGLRRVHGRRHIPDLHSRLGRAPAQLLPLLGRRQRSLVVLVRHDPA